MCYALKAAKKIQHISLTAAVSTRQHPSESSGVYCDDKRSFVFPLRDGRPYHLVSLEVVSILFCFLTKSLGLGVAD